MNILGIDLNAWRPNVTEDEFDKLHGLGCRFIGVRVSANNEADWTAEKFVDMARARGWVTFGYHYLSADKGDSNLQNGYEQGRVYAEAASALDLDGHFLDVEDGDTQWADVVAAVERMRAGTGEAIGLYSRRSFFEPKFGERDDIFDFEWMADYREAPNGVWLAKWEEFAAEAESDEALWQFSDELKWRYDKADGTKATRSVDGNLFAGSQVDLLYYLKGR